MSSDTHTAASWPHVERRVGLKRYLTKLDVWGTAFGSIVGWGAFVMPGTTFLPLAGLGGTVVGMLASVAIMLIVGANYSYLMRKRPRTGGIYAYAKEVFGRDHAFICSWFLTLSYTSIVFLNATALFVVSRTLLGSALQLGFHYQVAGYVIYTSEVALSAAALMGIGWLFIKHKPFLQKLHTSLALVLLLGTVCIAVFCLPHLDWSLVTSAEGITHHSLLPSVFTIILLSPWAFVGFDVISLETVHFDFSVRYSGRLIALSILAGGFTYTALSLVSISALPPAYATWQEYLANLDNLSGVLSVPTFYSVEAIVGPAGLVLGAITALAAILTGIIGAYRAAARMLATMAEDRIVPDSFMNTTFSVLFIMVISIFVSFLGRNALNWFVELTTFGAIVGFGYTSLSAAHIARAEGYRPVMVTGTLGALITCCFAVVQMIPRVTVFETMGPESFLMLSIWCLLGFVFYWKTMIQTTLDEHAGYHMSSTVLFSLLLYSALMWFTLTIVEAPTTNELHGMILRNAVILLVVVLTGLVVMVYVQRVLNERQDELKHEMIRAEESSRAKSRFLFNMSHDIRTPLNAIIGLTTLAREPGVSSTEKDAYLEKIEGSGQQLLGIINDVLDMSRIESGKMELFPEPCDLRDVLDQLRDLFQMQMESKGLTFDVRDTDLKNPWVLCDRNRLNRVLLNLLSNAYKFTPKDGSVSCELRQLGHTDETGTYELHVRDTGIGMNEEFVAHMFTPFERERTSTVSGIQGTGLGLAITKSIVDLMGGTIDVVTAPGKGSEFVIRLELPLADELAADESANGGLNVEGLHLLLVEDIDINREIAQLILEQHGCIVDVAENGQQAVEKVVSSLPVTYDAVLMDIQMPVMDGYEAARTIRALDDERLSRIPIIAMTANAFKEDELEAAEAGMQAHIAKPLEVDKMMATIAAVIDEHGEGRLG